MNWTYTVFAAVLHITAIISAFVGIVVLRRRKTPGSTALVILLFAVTEWSFTSGLEAAVVGLPYKIFWSKMEYLGALSAPTLFFIFVQEYTRHESWMKRSYLGMLSIVPLAGIITAATNWHNLIWTSFTSLPNQPNVILYGHGFGFFILVAYNYLIVSAGIVTLSKVWFRLRPPYRNQIGILLLGSLFPFAGGILYTLVPNFLPGLDLIPVCFSITSLVIVFDIYRFHLFDLAPIVRDILIDNMEEGVLVLDAQNRIVDVNPVAQSMFGTSVKQVLGQPAAEVLKSWPVLSKQLEDKIKGETEFRLGSDPPRRINMHISPLYDSHGNISSSLLVFHDITQRHKIEAELARAIEESNIINNISLAVTSGLDMEHVLKTLHEQCNQVAPMDIFYVALYDETNSLVHVPLFYEHGHYQAGPSRDIHDHPGTLGNVIQEQKTLVLNDPILPNTRPLSLEQSRSYIGIPLMLRERVIGVMSIQSYHPNAFNNDQIRILERIAIQAAIAIENARLYSEVQRLAIIDELTGIYNYRGLQELGTREVERALRFHRPLSVLFFDIDNFRTFNNTYNHLTGNIVLQNIAQHCHTILRTVDILTRFGGDEFVALLPETDITNAEAVARRMVDEIAAKKITTPFGELNVTISVGLTALADDHTSLSALIDLANHAEHQAKQGQKGILVVVP